MQNPLAEDIKFVETCELDKAATAINALAYPDVDARISDGLLFVPGFHSGEAELRVYSPNQVKRSSLEITLERVSSQIDKAPASLFVDQDVYPFVDEQISPQSVRDYLLQETEILSLFLTESAKYEFGLFGVEI